jgi:hypothetical protein
MSSLEHRYTRVENPGEGVAKVLAKGFQMGSRLSGKITRGSHYFGFKLHFY